MHISSHCFLLCSSAFYVWNTSVSPEIRNVIFLSSQMLWFTLNYYTMDSTVRLCDKQFIYTKEGRSTRTGGTLPQPLFSRRCHRRWPDPPPWGHRKSYRYLWDLEWLSKEQLWENRGMRGWKRLVMCKQQMVTIVVWPCPMPDQRSLSFLIKFHFWSFSWVSGSLPLCTRVSGWQ